jgi:hypothetical protein
VALQLRVLDRARMMMMLARVMARRGRRDTGTAEDERESESDGTHDRTSVTDGKHRAYQA